MKAKHRVTGAFGGGGPPHHHHHHYHHHPSYLQEAARRKIKLIKKCGCRRAVKRSDSIAHAQRRHAVLAEADSGGRGHRREDSERTQHGAWEMWMSVNFK